MARARSRKRCGVWARLHNRICGAPAAVGDRCWYHWGSRGTRGTKPPWTLTATADVLAAHPAHEHPREPHVRRQSRELSRWAAKELIRRGIITRAVFLASTTRPDRLLRSLEREGIRVEPEGHSELVRAYRFVVPERAPVSEL